MTTPRRRQDPVAIGRGWELALVVAAALSIVFGLVALLAVAVASQLFGDGWVWPDDFAAGMHALGGVLTANLGRVDTHHRLPEAGVVYAFIAVFETATLALLVRVGIALSRYFCREGMATRDEARQALGRGALLRAAVVIRPDLAAQRRSGIPSWSRRPQASSLALAGRAPKRRIRVPRRRRHR